MRAICANPASPLGENDFFRNQTGKLGKDADTVSAAGWYAAAVPEPTSGLLLLLGVAGLALKRRRA